MPRKLTFQFTESEAMLIRDAIAVSCGGSDRLTKTDRKRLVEIAEHVLLRAALAPEVETTQRPVSEPIDTWLLGDPTPGSPWRSVTLLAARSQMPGTVLACLTEGSEERAHGQGATTAEALASALNDLMGRQGT
jgi:hypothetical protein